ncbi:MAG: peptidoglycan-binding protein [Rhizobiaceae bacterium]
MRSAYPAHPGFEYQSSNTDAGAMGQGFETDRLTNIRRSIDSIEHRLNGAGAQGFGQSGQRTMPLNSEMAQNSGQPPYYPAAYSPVGVMQSQYNQLASQAASVAPPMSPQMMAPNAQQFAPQSALGMQNSAAEIASRQQFLNAGSTSPGFRQAAQQGGAANMGGLGQQLAQLKNEITGLRSQFPQPNAMHQPVPQQEIERIAKAIADLQAQQADNGPADRLAAEIDHLRDEMKSIFQKGVQDKLSSQTSDLTKRLQALGRDVRSAIRSEVRGQDAGQTEELARRLDEISQSVNQAAMQSANVVTPRVDSLSAQLDALHMVINDLPQTLAISRIEDRLDELTGKLGELNGLAADPESGLTGSGLSGDEFLSIEKRLDEIARALVAVSNSGKNAPKLDFTSMERVEARVAELARIMDTIADQGSDSDLGRLAVRIEGLTERLGSFEKYAENGDLGGANAMFAAPETGMIEEQLRALNARLDEAVGISGTASLEQQIQQLSQQVEEASNVNSSAAQMSKLEAQIGQILQQMDAGAPATEVDFTPVEARLNQIEGQLQASQNFSMEAAQQAAQQAVAMMGPNSEAGGVIDALAHELQSLQLMAQGEAAQNSQSVQHIQQTLQQVVDRLGTIEGALENTSTNAQTSTLPRAANLAGSGLTASAAETHLDENAFVSDGLNDGLGTDDTPGVIHQAAIDAGFVNPNESVPDLPSEDLTDAVEDPAIDNTPLEPGSAAPSVDSLIQRATEELNASQAKHAERDNGHVVAAPAKDQTPDQKEPTAEITMPADIEDTSASEKKGNDERPDAVAAARRALQATSAEMTAVRKDAVASESKKKGSGPKSKLLSSVPTFDKSKLRKPLILGAAVLILAIVTFKGIGLFTGSSQKPVAKIDATGPEISSTVESETFDTLDEPRDNVRTVGTESDARPEMMPSPAPVKQAEAEPVQGEAAATPQPVNLPPAAVPAETEVQASVPQSVEAVEAQSVQAETSKQDVATGDASSANSAHDVPDNAGPAALIAAARGGDPKALFQVGMRYSNGEDVNRNMTEAAKWFTQSAQSGFAPAQYSVGSLYEKGIGVERNVSQALDWYEKAAVQGNARAMHNLAVIYAMGNPPTVQPNMDTAVDWFKKAADYGIKDSQFNLGILYGQGMGVPQNLIESYKWFALAAKTGDNDASKKRDEVANAMDPEDLAYARREVNNWVPKKLDESVNRIVVPDEWKGASKNAKAAKNETTRTTYIRDAQAQLNQRGFLVGEPDGLIGPKTKQAIMDFQKSAGIPITGEVDRKLLQALDLAT